MNSTSLPRVALLRHQLFLKSETFITEQARSMRRFRPLLVGRSTSGQPAGGVEFRVPSVELSASLFGYVLLRNPRLILRTLGDWDPSLLHAHFGVEGVYGLRVAERLRVPLVTTFHGFDASLRNSQLIRSRKPSWVVYALKKQALARQGSLFLCVSKFIQDRVLQQGFPENSTRLHYIGVDIRAFESNQEDPDNPILLHTARLVEKKGTSYLLKAFAAIARKHARATLIVIGDGPLKEHLMSQAVSLGIGNRVSWLGARPHSEVKSWMSRASLFCLPSCTAASGDAEGLPTVVVEAAASGLPVVATYHGGIPEAVIDSETGFLVAEREVTNLADALDALLSSSDLRKRVGQRAMQFVAANFDVHRQTSKLEDMYESLL